ncbi:alpha/beta fold hydrolase [Aurantimonas sp. VKM B-3413]|uniref:alpha/beta fold hydrolase n=1 Tax=Aurantimonas sp. VKM B-3413 TaxID=2779401 RepID=UPI001E31B540|nr:alpha/beta fold hydrolase [Aurantimonas sp. VKM B-3413]MCB8839807.1 alpha/beta hydrolase [Aurantimonas sp. VKM B-3413]
MTTVQLAGIVAEVSGEGMPVVLIHGLGGTANTYEPLMEALSSYRVIRIDMPGSGRSPVPHDAPTIESFASDIVRAVRSLAVERAHFVGHSLGTIVCQKIAADNPALVASLALYGALTEPPEGARTGLGKRAQMARAGEMSEIADQIVGATLAPGTRSSQPAVAAFVRESVMRQNPEGYARTCEALAKAERVDSRLISVPTLLVTGENDPVAPVAMARELADAIAGASLHVLAQCGHWSLVERPAECSRKLVEFLRRVER